MTNQEAQTFPAWKFDHGRFEREDIEWDRNVRHEENLQLHGCDPLTVLAIEDLLVYIQHDSGRILRYFVIHEFVQYYEIIICPNYPALLGYLTIATPPVMAGFNVRSTLQALEAQEARDRIELNERSEM